MRRREWILIALGAALALSTVIGAACIADAQAQSRTLGRNPISPAAVAGPTTSTWATVLGNGATSGGSDPVISSGDSLTCVDTSAGETKISVDMTPSAAWTGDMVDLDCGGTHCNGAVLNVESNDVGAVLQSWSNGTADVLSIAQTSAITLIEGATFNGSVTGSAAPAESIFDFQGTNSGTGTHPANIVNVEWTGAGGSGTQNGVRVNAPTGWTGDGYWFGVIGAEKFAVDQTGSAVAAASFIAPTLNVDDYQKGISYVANSGVHIFSRGSAGPNNSVCLVDYASRGKSYDHANQATPTFWFQSDENPDVSNQEWGSITHDGTDFVLGTGGPAAGTGSAPTTIRNSIRMDQNLVTTLQSGGDNQAATLGVGATTVAITTDFLTLTGDGGGNTIGPITGGITGQTLRVLCVDADVAITDTDAHTADTVDLSAAFTCADDTVLTLLYDGTSWYETSRSVN